MTETATDSATIEVPEDVDPSRFRLRFLGDFVEESELDDATLESALEAVLLVVDSPASDEQLACGGR